MPFHQNKHTDYNDADADNGQQRCTCIETHDSNMNAQNTVDGRPPLLRP